MYNTRIVDKIVIQIYLSPKTSESHDTDLILRSSAFSTIADAKMHLDHDIELNDNRSLESVLPGYRILRDYRSPLVSGNDCDRSCLGPELCLPIMDLILVATTIVSKNGP